MDMLTNAQETMHTSAESLQSFTRSERVQGWEGLGLGTGGRLRW